LLLKISFLLAAFQCRLLTIWLLLVAVEVVRVTLVAVALEVI
jgi:hypothetical protein